jgi:hypothetical protein
MTGASWKTGLAILIAALAMWRAENTADAHNSWAVADNVIAVHGTTPTSNPVQSGLGGYWTDWARRWMCGNGARCSMAYQVAWNGRDKRWDDHDNDSPGCVVARAVFAIPGVNISLIGHSQGGIVIAHLVHDIAGGWAGGWSCGVDLNQAGAWIGNLHAISAPFNGNQLADSLANPLFCLPFTATAWTLVGPSFFLISPFIRPRAVTALESGPSGMGKFPGWLSNLGSYTLYTSYGTFDDWLGGWDHLWCMGGSGDVGIHDGVVDKFSARAGKWTKNANQWLDGVGVRVNHLEEGQDTRGTGPFGNESMTFQVWSHDFY